MNKEWKKEITKNERLQLIGLMVVANSAYKTIKDCELAMAEIIAYKPEGYSSGDAHLLSDAIFDEKPNVDIVLKNMQIKVKK